MTTTSTAVLPLSGVRVVDLTCDVGEMCGRWLADLGADVCRVDPPGGSPTRRRPPRAPNGESVWWAYRNANKHGIEIDPTSDGQILDRRLRTAELLLVSGRDSAFVNDPRAVADAHPKLVVTSLSWFGLDGPYSGYRATDDVVVAMSGWLANSGPSTQPPVLVPGSVASDAASVTGLLATLLALRVRAGTGAGQLIDVSAQEAVAQIDSWAIPNASVLANSGHAARRVRAAEKGIYPVLRTTDGFVRMVLLAPRHWQSLFEWMGSPPEFADPFWAHPVHRFANTDVLNPAFQAFFGSMTMLEAATEAHRRGIVVTPINTMADLVIDEHLRDRGTFCDAALAGAPAAPVVIGPFEFNGRRAGFRTAFTNDESDGIADGVRPTGAESRAPSAAPLAGVRVLDFGHGGVGVQAGRMLAEFGADVIKIESRGYLDFMRIMSGGETSPSFASSSRSKRSFGVNLKSAEGIALVKRLAALADVVIENNSTGTMAALGIAFDDLRAVNPHIVYLSSQSLGARGRRAQWSGYGPSVQAYAGFAHLYRPADSEPLAHMANHPDLLAGSMCASAIVAGLFQSAQTGSATHCEMAQVEILLSMLGDLVAADAIAPGSVRPEGNDDERGAPWGVFRCAGPEEWCVICVTDNAEWNGLLTAMDRPGWANDPVWEDAATRRARRAELHAKIEAWTMTLTPADVAARCQAAGVPAGPMLYAADLLTDAHLEARGFLPRLDQPGIGPLVLEGVAFVADAMVPCTTPAPALGEHTRSIAAELLGLDANAIEDLVERGVLEVEPPVTAPTG